MVHVFFFSFSFQFACLFTCCSFISSVRLFLCCFILHSQMNAFFSLRFCFIFVLHFRSIAVNFKHQTWYVCIACEMDEIVVASLSAPFTWLPVPGIDLIMQYEKRDHFKDAFHADEFFFSFNFQCVYARGFLFFFLFFYFFFISQSYLFFCMNFEINNHFDFWILIVWCINQWTAYKRKKNIG